MKVTLLLRYGLSGALESLPCHKAAGSYQFPGCYVSLLLERRQQFFLRQELVQALFVEELFVEQLFVAVLVLQSVDQAQ